MAASEKKGFDRTKTEEDRNDTRILNFCDVDRAESCQTICFQQNSTISLRLLLIAFDEASAGDWGGVVSNRER